MPEPSRKTEMTNSGAEVWAGTMDDLPKRATHTVMEGATEGIKSLMQGRALLRAEMTIGVRFAIAKLLRR